MCMRRRFMFGVCWRRTPNTALSLSLSLSGGLVDATVALAAACC